MSGYATETRKKSWQRCNESYADVKSRISKRERARPTRGLGWSNGAILRLLFQCLWFLVYSSLQIAVTIGCTVIAILAIPVLIFGPILVVAILLGASTQVFRAFGLV